MIKLFGQLLVPPALSVLALTVLFADWWGSVGMRTRWSVWILLSASLLLLFQLVWTIIDRRRAPREADSEHRFNDNASAASSPPSPPKQSRPAPENYPVLSEAQELRVLTAARRVLAGHFDQVELYRDRDRLVVREVRFKRR